ncbi:hypothetical protein N9242_00290 [Vicingaceae bacterium]|nr:hypothetical protein [Vicingaceae bacterium]
MKVLFPIILILLSFLAQSQTTEQIKEQEIAVKMSGLRPGSETIKTLSLNLIGIPKNNQGALKDDFLDYKKKIISLDYNEFNESMVIIYFGLSKEKIDFLLKSNEINTSIINNTKIKY